MGSGRPLRVDIGGASTFRGNHSGPFFPWETTGCGGQERGWIKSGCGWNKSIVGTNSKMTCRNREYFLLSAPCSESQGAEEKGKNIYHVPTLHQTFCLHFQVTSFKLRRNCSRLFHPPHSIGKSRSPYR